MQLSGIRIFINNIFNSQYRMRSTTPERIFQEKDRTIRKLKTDILPYKQQEQALPILDHNLRAINDRYKNLQHQKLLSQNENRNRYESSVRIITDLKNQFELLKNQQREASNQLNLLNADRISLNTSLNKFSDQIDLLKNQSITLYQENESLNNERLRLLQIQDALTNQNIQADNFNTGLTYQNNDVNQKVSETKIYVNELTNKKKILFDKIVHFEQVNNQLDEEISKKSELEERLLLEMRKKDDFIKQQIQNLLELENRSKKIRNDIFTKSTIYKNQTEKGIDLNHQIKQAQNALKQYEDRILAEQQETRAVAKENQEIVKVNQQIMTDLNHCEEHRDNLLLHNQFLNNELNKFADQDEFIKKVVSARRKLNPLP